MNKIGKILVVFVAIAALSFMALTGAVTLGGPNWFGKAQELTDYTLEESPGETITYTMRRRNGDFSTPQSANLAQVVVAALQNQKQEQTQREQELDQQIETFTRGIESTSKAKQEDIKAIDSRLQEFSQYVTEMNQQIDQINASIDELTAANIALNEELTLRREDVLRFRDQLAAIRTDRDRLVVQRKELQDILALLQGSIGQMERRAEQLRKQHGYDPQTN